jgi:hypothetical protein
MLKTNSFQMRIAILKIGTVYGPMLSHIGMSPRITNLIPILKLGLVAPVIVRTASLSVSSIGIGESIVACE